MMLSKNLRSNIHFILFIFKYISSYNSFIYFIIIFDMQCPVYFFEHSSGFCSAGSEKESFQCMGKRFFEKKEDVFLDNNIYNY